MPHAPCIKTLNFKVGIKTHEHSLCMHGEQDAELHRRDHLVS